MMLQTTSTLRGLTGEAVVAARYLASSHGKSDAFIDVEPPSPRIDRAGRGALDANGGEPEGSIGRLMQEKHRQCDDSFSKAEAFVFRNDWGQGRNAFDLFRHAMKLHLSMEEDVLLPSLGQRVAAASTAAIRMEHDQMRLILTDLEEAMAEENRDLFLRFSRTLRTALEQHTKKEEAILYALGDEAFGGEADEIIRRMKSL
jgi:hypothetical protein